MAEPRVPLRTCPFCGDKPSYRTYTDEDLTSHDQVTYHEVYCTCDVGPSYAIPDGYEGGTAEEVWNKRPSKITVAQALMAVRTGILR